MNRWYELCSAFCPEDDRPMTFDEMAHIMPECPKPDFAPAVAALVSRLYGVRVRCDVHFGHGIPGKPGYAGSASVEARTVNWDTAGGIEPLLHEVGHLVGPNCISKSRWLQSPEEVLEDERQAWLWADRAAQDLGLPFNREYAEGGYYSYLWSSFPRSEWAHRPMRWEDSP